MQTKILISARHHQALSPILVLSALLSGCATEPAGPPSANRWTSITADMAPIRLPATGPFTILSAKMGAQKENSGTYQIVLSNDTSLPDANTLTIETKHSRRMLPDMQPAQIFPGARSWTGPERLGNGNGPFVLFGGDYGVKGYCLLLRQVMTEDRITSLRACSTTADQAAILTWFAGLVPVDGTR